MQHHSHRSVHSGGPRSESRLAISIKQVSEGKDQLNDDIHMQPAPTASAHSQDNLQLQDIESRHFYGEEEVDDGMEIEAPRKAVKSSKCLSARMPSRRRRGTISKFQPK